MIHGSLGNKQQTHRRSYVTLHIEHVRLPSELERKVNLRGVRCQREFALVGYPATPVAWFHAPDVTLREYVSTRHTSDALRRLPFGTSQLRPLSITYSILAQAKPLYSSAVTQKISRGWRREPALKSRM